MFKLKNLKWVAILCCSFLMSFTCIRMGDTSNPEPENEYHKSLYKGNGEWNVRYMVSTPIGLLQVSIPGICDSVKFNRIVFKKNTFTEYRFDNVRDSIIDKACYTIDQADIMTVKGTLSESQPGGILKFIKIDSSSIPNIKYTLMFTLKNDPLGNPLQQPQLLYCELTK